MGPRRKSSVEVKRIEESAGGGPQLPKGSSTRKCDVPSAGHEAVQRGNSPTITAATVFPKPDIAEMMPGHEEPLTLTKTTFTKLESEEHDHEHEHEHEPKHEHEHDHDIQFEMPEETFTDERPSFTNGNPPSESKTTTLSRATVVAEGREMGSIISNKSFGTTLMPSPSPSTSASASLSLHTDDDCEDLEEEEEVGEEGEEEGQEQREVRTGRPYEMRRRASEDPMGDEGSDGFSYMPLAKRHAVRLHGRTRSVSSVTGEAALQQAAILSSLGSLNSSTRRQAHIVSEQKRRQSINEGFEDLRKVVPACTNQGDSKAIVLRKAVTYISQLHAEMNRIKTGSSVGVPSSNSPYGGSMASHSSSIAPPGPGGRYYTPVASPVPSASHSSGHAVPMAVPSPHHSYLGHYSHHNTPAPPPQYHHHPSSAGTVNGASTPVLSSPSILSPATIASAISNSSRPSGMAYPTLPLPAANFAARTASPPLTAVNGSIGGGIKLPSATSLPHFSTTTPVTTTSGHSGSRTMPPAPAGYYGAIAALQHRPPPPPLAQAPHHSQPQSPGAAQPSYPSGASVYNRDDYLSAASLSMLRQLDTSR